MLSNFPPLFPHHFVSYLLWVSCEFVFLRGGVFQETICEEHFSWFRELELVLPDTLPLLLPLSLSQKNNYLPLNLDLWAILLWPLTEVIFHCAWRTNIIFPRVYNRRLLTLLFVRFSSIWSITFFKGDWVCEKGGCDQSVHKETSSAYICASIPLCSSSLKKNFVVSHWTVIVYLISVDPSLFPSLNIYFYLTVGYSLSTRIKA